VCFTAPLHRLPAFSFMAALGRRMTAIANFPESAFYVIFISRGAPDRIPPLPRR